MGGFFSEPQALAPLLPHSIKQASASWFFATALGLDKALVRCLEASLPDFLIKTLNFKLFTEQGPNVKGLAGLQ